MHHLRIISNMCCTGEFMVGLHCTSEVAPNVADVVIYTIFKLMITCNRNQKWLEESRRRKRTRICWRNIGKHVGMVLAIFLGFGYMTTIESDLKSY